MRSRAATTTIEDVGAVGITVVESGGGGGGGRGYVVVVVGGGGVVGDVAALWCVAEML